MTTSTPQSENATNTSVVEASNDVQMADTEEKSVNGMDEESATNDNKTGKRKRSTKKTVEVTENISNARPKRSLQKRKRILIIQILS